MAAWQWRPGRCIGFSYRHLDCDKIPRFQALREKYEAFLAAELLKHPAVACGDDGFTNSQPLPETWAETTKWQSFLMSAFG